MANPQVPGASLSVEDVGYRVDAAQLLDTITVRASAGEFVGLVGPNGAGKSTLLRAIDHIIRPSAGSIRLDGRALADLSPRQIARIVALVPQSTVLDFGFTCVQVVLMGRNPHLAPLRPEGSADWSIAHDAMAATETLEFAHRSIVEMSGGERQRVFVARALAQQPRLLLLDEPTSNLDVGHQLQILDLVSDLVTRGVTAIAAIHDLNLAARYCHRLVLLHRGRIRASGPVAEVLTPEHLAATFGVHAVVGPDPVLETLRVTVVSRLLTSSPPEPTAPVPMESRSRAASIG
ncbi:MAG: ABC transporter ATP-binding protein [Chloroflexi bacterium]|nr:ABC transporter ATP-binding protein [Chloroflexota bacterium]